MNQKAPAHRFGAWFLEKVLRQFAEEFHKKVYMGTRIDKADTYRVCSWWWRLSRPETRLLLTALAKRYDGVKYNGRGLWIHKELLNQLDAEGSSSSLDDR